MKNSCNVKKRKEITQVFLCLSVRETESHAANCSGRMLLLKVKSLILQFQTAKLQMN